jgi:hypothetical protein
MCVCVYFHWGWVVDICGFPAGPLESSVGISLLFRVSGGGIFGLPCIGRYFCLAGREDLILMVSLSGFWNRLTDSLRADGA